MFLIKLNCLYLVNVKDGCSIKLYVYILLIFLNMYWEK